MRDFHSPFPQYPDHGRGGSRAIGNCKIGHSGAWCAPSGCNESGLEASDEEITDGLDVTRHGEPGYSL